VYFDLFIFFLVNRCIPYRLKEGGPIGSCIDEAIEVLVISSQKGHGMMFPKGGWELDETEDQAVAREAMEEAGVLGTLLCKLGSWNYISKRYNILYEGSMFALNVTNELPKWPEMDTRKRKWVSVAEAREGCQHKWMTYALDKLVSQLSM
jgi:diphosphoinositol-polyphosphate diphosphatase